MYRVLVKTLFLALLAFNQAVHAELVPPQLFVTLPGDVLAIDSPGSQPPPSELPFQWYSVSIDSGNLRVDSATRTRSPDWTVVRRSTGVTEIGGTVADSTAATEPARHALALPTSALLAFRFDGGEPITSSPLIPFGTYPSAAPPFLLSADLRVAVAIGNESWTLSTEHARRKDGQLLAGSLALAATSPSGERLILVPPAAGMAFLRQEVLWVGRVTSSSLPSLILRRTWVTGEIDYVVTFDGAIGYARFDPDRAMRSFSSGVEEYESFERHVAQRRQPPNGKFGAAALAMSEDLWNASFERITETGLPGTLLDRQLSANAAGPVRFTVEYLPRWTAGDKERSSTNPEFFWEGPLLVKIHFRGKSQVLLQLGNLDGGPFRIQLDQLNGELAIEAAVSPHYNNSFVYYWIWSEADGRFLRLLSSHSQGC